MYFYINLTHLYKKYNLYKYIMATKITIDTVIAETTNLMNMDSLDAIVQAKIINVITLILLEPQYTDYVKTQFQSIENSDSTSTPQYLTSLLTLAISVNKNLSSFVKLSNNVNTNMMKYIVYASIYFYLILHNPDFFVTFQIDEFRLLYGTLWTLIELDPATIKAFKTKCLSCCCGVSSVKNPPATSQTNTTTDNAPTNNAPTDNAPTNNAPAN